MIAALVFGSAIGAHADNDIYYNTLKQPRGDDALHADGAICDAQFGAPQNGTVTSWPYRRCMLAHGWRLAIRFASASNATTDIPTPIIPA
jgi:hypothetical protein